MSTVKTNNLQIGQSVTATNNFTWYQPASPDGTVRLGVGNAGATSSDILIANSSGNLGLGVTPSAWNSVYRSLQIGSASSISGRTNSNLLELGSNSYRNSGGGWTYITTDTASRYDLADGTHRWYTAPSGTAGNAISFTQAMTLDASGNLLVGKTTLDASVVGVQLEPSGGVAATRSSSSNANLVWYTYSTGAAAARFYVGMGGTVYATNTTISAISDQRLKENIRDLDDGLAAILSLKPRKFDWKEGKGKDIKNDRGFIAQEFEQVFPDMIESWADPAPEGEEPYKAVNANLIPTLVKAIQELSAELNELKQKVNA